MRAARRVQAAGGATGTVMTDRRRAAARRMRQIAGTLRTRGKLSREESTQVIRRVTGELAGLAEKSAAQAAAVVRNGRRAVPKAVSGRMRGRLVRALDELTVTIERTAQVVAQARIRVAGQTPDGATRLVSLHDPDARPIRKGRIDRPVEFGYKAQVTDNDDGVILDCSLQQGNPGDGPQLAPLSTGSSGAPGRNPARLPPTAAMASSPSKTNSTTWASATWSSPARANPARPARPPSAGAHSGGTSSGEPAAKRGSPPSSASTGGTAPAWTAPKAPGPGPGTES